VALNFNKKGKNNMSTASSNSGPQLNTLRSTYNELVSKKLFLGKSKKVQWESRRRFGNI
jgi:hypothetical protein